VPNQQPLYNNYNRSSYQKPLNNFDNNHKGGYQKKNQWADWEAAPGQQVASGQEMQKYKVKNTPINDSIPSTSAPKFKVGAAEFKPFTPLGGFGAPKAAAP
jgi:hypothetical protein